MFAFLMFLSGIIVTSCSSSPDNANPPLRLSSKEKVVICYFGSWSTWRHGNGFFDVEDIDPFLCTHLIFGFAGIDYATNKVKVLDEYNELDPGSPHWGKGAYRRFTGLKAMNPSLVTLLAVGGWNEG